MKLAVPTDFDIFEAFSDRRRNTTVNPSYVLDKNRSHINTRLPILADYGLLTRVGPTPNPGLYEITDKGLVVPDNRGQYRTDGIDFDTLAESELRARTGEASA